MFFGLFSSGDELLDKIMYMALGIIVIFIVIFFIMVPLTHI